jgi:ribonucleoside-diphosphate reductase beta chain
MLDNKIHEYRHFYIHQLTQSSGALLHHCFLFLKFRIMSLLDAKKTYKPFEYPWAYELFKKQHQMHWLPEEVAMADDVRDWKQNLTDNERNLCTQIFRFFTQADIEVNDCYMTRYASIFKPVEIKMMLAAFSSMEAIHVDAYSHLIDTLGMPEGIYEEFLRYKEMKDKSDFLSTIKHDTKEGIATTLAVFGAFTEGMQLFSSFAILLNFQRFGKMKGMGQIITWSIRDETLHTNAIIKLFNTFVSENPELWNNDLKNKIKEVCQKMVEMEDDFIDVAFSVADNVEGLSSFEVKKYIRYIADRRLTQLNLDPIYNIEKNPLPWLDYILNSMEHTNFFDNRSTEYARAATTGTWEEAFAIHDVKITVDI